MNLRLHFGFVPFLTFSPFAVSSTWRRSWISPGLFSLLIAWPVSLQSANAIRPKADSTAYFFAGTNAVRLDIQISESGLNELRQSHPGASRFDPNSPRPETTCTVTEGDQVYTNVAIHLKGYTSFRPIDDHPGLTLNFSKFVRGRKFHGLAKLSLNNASQDPSRLNEKFSRELFAAAGVPVPRADFAAVTLNGRRLGVYVLVEGYDREFLKRFFPRSDGELYDAGILEDVNWLLQENRSTGAGRAALEKLIAAAREPDPDRRFRALQEVLDLDRFISMLAMETILCHSDSYSMNRNNYRIYRNPENNRLVFMPHGMDRILGGHRSGLDLSVVPPMLGIVARGLISTPEGRRLHIDRVGTLFTNLFQPSSLCQRVQELETRISELNIHHHEGDFCARLQTRASWLKVQFGQSPEIFAMYPSPNFDLEGRAPLDRWKPRLILGTNQVACEEVVVKEKRLWRITLPAGRRGISMRCPISLPAGIYRVVGHLKVGGPDSEEFRPLGVTLARYGKDRFGQELTSFGPGMGDFEIQVSRRYAPEEMEFICEIRGMGEIWLDPGSLAVVRRVDGTRLSRNAPN